MAQSSLSHYRRWLGKDILGKEVIDEETHNPSLSAVIFSNWARQFEEKHAPDDEDGGGGLAVVSVDT